MGIQFSGVFSRIPAQYKPQISELADQVKSDVHNRARGQAVDIQETGDGFMTVTGKADTARAEEFVDIDIYSRLLKLGLGPDHYDYQGPARLDMLGG